MYRRISDFADTWKYETESTIKLMNVLTNASLDQKINPEGRTLGRLAWHITETIGEMLNRTGLQVEEPQASGHLHNPTLIADTYERVAQQGLAAVQENWTDESLEIKHNMYGEEWTRGTILTILVQHQIHHRGQMTVLMRQAGLVVPGIYGPAREEWAAMNMPAMA
jgi:uncharacterized damage-inducible protein DinB